MSYEVALMGWGREIQPRDITGDLLESFLNFIDAKPQTFETYKRALKPFFLYLGGQGILRPTRRTILDYRDKIRQALKPSTVQIYMTAVRLFFRWAYQEGLYPNVADGVKGASPSKEHKQGYFTSLQAKDILNKIDQEGEQGRRDYALVLLMLTLGFRTIEIVRANIEDVRPVGDRIAMYYQGKHRDDKGQLKIMGPETEKALREYLNTRGERNARAPLFASTSNNNKGERMTTRAISGIVKRHMVQAGYSSDRLTAHSLRHTAATLNRVNGGTLEETSEHLGHSSTETTKIYDHHLNMASNLSGLRIEAAILRA